MTHLNTKVTVIDDYFPSWMVRDVGNYLSTDFPFFYNNTPYGDYSNCLLYTSDAADE